MNVTLSNEESAALRKALRSYLSDLRMEIVDTDNPTFKHELQAERDLLEETLRRIDDASADSGEAGADGGGSIVVVSLVWSKETP